MVIMIENWTLVCICQQCEDSFKTASSALPEGKGTAHAKKKATAVEETLTLEELSQTQTPDHRFQAPA